MENHNGEPVFTYIKIYLVRDNVQGTYLAPVCSVHITEIRRALTAIVNNDQHKFGQYTSDFSLYQNGTMNEMTGEIITPDKPEFILNLTELKEKPWPKNKGKEINPPIPNKRKHSTTKRKKAKK